MKQILLKPLITPPKTDIFFGLHALLESCSTKQGVILVDSAITHSHGKAIQKQLHYELIEVPSGEKNKTRKVKETLEDELSKRKMGRDSTIVAMGGGVTTDLVGFMASTYLRGLPLVLLPTTLLAMVDAAIGGKTGVDTPFGKNLIGSFYLPKAIFIEIDFLKTLPEKEMKNGLSEILKYGLIQKSSIWKTCQGNWQQEISSLIEQSIQCKVDIVQKDYEEKGGLRRILNFGHTVGHALELISHYQMGHGEAVALGCMAESFLSHLLGYLPEESLHEILILYQKLGYAFKELDTPAFLQALQMDKKTKNGVPRFVMIDAIGHAVPFDGEYCRTAAVKDLEELTQWMQHGQR
ncbi:MAG: hypothetical protein ACD_17C00501G0006 [uncultured bacterium]|nr:MAG: hypothetical protein ACD_17C00501G0006 [uncultured bacterium]OGN56615.1 MAG: 3-dehydroquinate synthase [Chlamydiae bacterium RIFCSPHIGHO2_01_FULL_44_39]OGN59112.1 MAG: 3-dehydroquinate synthase [Chlamydiae bacterium RIFCSPHIGHO2_02_FULL_45_9]OGN61123.1 MAG: 3-dehydroquinate synthase [Chlamydiae bacterium RIFCSPHIGHO2_12_FULL_44_59]OGN65593.1 MAG: 3-dehydroquinate synthase [Chlamydiae bacterium RIFCSPLOWO2_01_FULL_44_52]OGN68070.1 MAG: 3-dehydroquinate synthase [Chlamydiae bacterium RIF